MTTHREGGRRRGVGDLQQLWASARGKGRVCARDLQKLVEGSKDQWVGIPPVEGAKCSEGLQTHLPPSLSLIPLVLITLSFPRPLPFPFLSPPLPSLCPSVPLPLLSPLPLPLRHPSLSLPCPLPPTPHLKPAAHSHVKCP